MVLEKVPELLSKFSALDTAIIVALITGTISTITYVVGNIVNNVMEKIRIFGKSGRSHITG